MTEPIDLPHELPTLRRFGDPAPTGAFRQVTVNLVPAALDAVIDVARRHNISHTDAFNLALREFGAIDTIVDNTTMTLTDVEGRPYKLVTLKAYGIGVRE